MAPCGDALGSARLRIMERKANCLLKHTIVDATENALSLLDALDTYHGNFEGE